MRSSATDPAAAARNEDPEAMCPWKPPGTVVVFEFLAFPRPNSCEAKPSICCSMWPVRDFVDGVLVRIREGGVRNRTTPLRIRHERRKQLVTKSVPAVQNLPQSKIASGLPVIHPERKFGSMSALA